MAVRIAVRFGHEPVASARFARTEIAMALHTTFRACSASLSLLAHLGRAAPGYYISHLWCLLEFTAQRGDQ